MFIKTIVIFEQRCAAAAACYDDETLIAAQTVSFRVIN